MAEAKVETKLCSNCKRQINVNNFMMHEAFCFKNNRPCEICKEIIDINTKDEHFEEFHAKQKCECGQEIEKSKFEDHKNNLCPKRKMKCQYCDLTLNYDGFEAHVSSCGTRTEACEICNRYIQKKDKGEHDRTNCEYPPQPVKTKPARPIISDDEDEMFNNRFLSNNQQKIASLMMKNNGIPNFYNKPTTTTTTTNNRITKNRPLLINSSITTPVDNKNSRITKNKPLLINSSVVPAADNVDMIPCEFCHNVFPIDALFQHQTECEDNRSITPSPSANNLSSDASKPAARAVDNNNRHKPKPISTTTTSRHETNIQHDRFDADDEEDIVLPCEFCNEIFPASALFQHQSNCVQNTATIRHPINNDLGIDILNDYNNYDLTKTYSISRPNGLSANYPHYNSTIDTTNYNNINNMLNRNYDDDDDVDADDDSDKIPCEFCHKPIKTSLLDSHQRNCQNAFNQLDGVQNLRLNQQQASSYAPIRPVKTFGSVARSNQTTTSTRTPTIVNSRVVKKTTPEQISRKETTNTSVRTINESNTTTKRTPTKPPLKHSIIREDSSDEMTSPPSKPQPRTSSFQVHVTDENKPKPTTIRPPPMRSNRTSTRDSTSPKDTTTTTTTTTRSIAAKNSKTPPKKNT